MGPQPRVDARFPPPLELLCISTVSMGTRSNQRPEHCMETRFPPRLQSLCVSTVSMADVIEPPVRTRVETDHRTPPDSAHSESEGKTKIGCAAPMWIPATAIRGPNRSPFTRSPLKCTGIEVVFGCRYPHGRSVLLFDALHAPSDCAHDAPSRFGGRTDASTRAPRLADACPDHCDARRCESLRVSYIHTNARTRIDCTFTHTVRMPACRDAPEIGDSCRNRHLVRSAAGAHRSNPQHFASFHRAVIHT